jgi:hypothetical protein
VIIDIEIYLKSNKIYFFFVFLNIEADLVKLSSTSVLTPMQELGVNKALRLFIIEIKFIGIVFLF